MNKRLTLLGVITAVFGMATAEAELKPLPIEQIAKHPAVTSVSMSLEGDMLVGVVVDPEDPNEQAAAYWDLSGAIDTTKPLLPSNITQSSGRMKFYGASALKNKKSLWFGRQAYVGALMGCGEGKTTGSTKKYIQKVFMGNEKIKKIDDLPDGRAEIGANKMQLRCFELEGDTAIASLLPLDPTKIVITRATTKSGTSYFEHDLANGQEKFLYKGSASEGIGIDDRTGQPFARAKTEMIDGEWHQLTKLIDPRTGDFTVEDPLTVAVKNRYNMDVLSQQNGTTNYFVATDKFSDKVAIYLYDVVTDTFSDEPVFAHPDFSIGNVIFSDRAADFGAPLGFTYLAAVSEVFWIDPEMKSIQDGLDAAFPGKHVTLNSYNDDRNRILFTVSSASYPPTYFMLVDKSKVALIGTSEPGVDSNTLGETELIYYTARDGLKIPGLLTLPKGLAEGERPKGAIVLPHGGPWSRDSAGWDGSGWKQFFATRGYAVLQPQFRGSTDWGRELWLAGDREWGLKMQDDNDDAAAWLASEGHAPSDKIAIFGYSYGGFAAMAATVRPDGPFQCAIAGAGVSNLAQIKNNWSENRLQRVYQGRTVDGMDPMQNVDKASIPILVYHGDYDVRVPLFHGVDFYNAVKKKQPESELLVLKQMGHQGNKWLPEHHVQSLTAIQDFLAGPCGM